MQDVTPNAMSRAFDTTPDFWLNLQKNYDLWHAEKESQEWKKVRSFPKSVLHQQDSALSSEHVVQD
jgi:plasmid maintenance system antidote protein VapI